MDYPERAEADFGETVECTGKECSNHIRVEVAHFASGLPFCIRCFGKLPDCHSCGRTIGVKPVTVLDYGEDSMVVLSFCNDAERSAYFKFCLHCGKSCHDDYCSEGCQKEDMLDRM